MPTNRVSVDKDSSRMCIYDVAVLCDWQSIPMIADFVRENAYKPHSSFLIKIFSTSPLTGLGWARVVSPKML